MDSLGDKARRKTREADRAFHEWKVRAKQKRKDLEE
ncbi:hypothetical protein BH23PAT1_BH23PAT1_2940 [soil metagenome]